MALNSDVSKALSYLRHRYKVKERDLVALAKKFKTAEEQRKAGKKSFRGHCVIIKQVDFLPRRVEKNRGGAKTGNLTSNQRRVRCHLNLLSSLG